MLMFLKQPHSPQMVRCSTNQSKIIQSLQPKHLKINLSRQQWLPFSAVLCYIFLGSLLYLENGIEEDKVESAWKL